MRERATYVPQHSDYSKSLIYSELVNNEDMQLYSYHTKQTEAKKLHYPKNQETE